MKMKTVCIIGGGPSGLVAAKTLLWRGSNVPEQVRFKITVIEGRRGVGGLWPTSTDESKTEHGMIHPLMLANQSRHTVQFSDLAWEDVFSEGSEIKEFPRAWQVGRYLEAYYKRYLSGRDDCDFQLARRVIRADPVDGGHGGWHVYSQGRDELQPVDAGVFDYLVVASGYFGRPIIPMDLADTVRDSASDMDLIPVIHSSQYRDLKQLFENRATKSGKIVIAGGQFSGVEIAGTIASHLSSARHAPGKLTHPDVSVANVVQRPFWVYPLYNSPIAAPETTTPVFLPFDFCSYNYRKRPQPLKDSQGHITVTAARRLHGFMRATLGTDQSEFSPLVAVNERSPEILDSPPYIGVSNTYLEHVREKTIALHRGKVVGVDQATKTVTLSTGEKLEGVGAVILATGFNAASSLSFFSDEIKGTIQFDAKDSKNTSVLSFHATNHARLPHVAFVGYYRSSYWGVMEMQARVAAALFTEDILRSSPARPDDLTWYPSSFQQFPRLMEALAADTSMERTLKLRAEPLRTSQFPMGDYLYLMDQFGQALGLERRAAGRDGDLVVDGSMVMEIVTSAAYTEDDASTDQKLSTAKSLQATYDVAMAALYEHKFVAKSVFRSLLGTWKLDRSLTSRLPTHPSGRFVGTAEFRPRNATDDGVFGKVDHDDEEYLYVEDGIFTATSGPSFRATRRYVWRYNSQKDQVTVWFARTDDNDRADYLFHPLEFKTGKKGWEATAGHLCIDDFYDVHYQFSFSGVRLGDWQLRYGVRGPKKDYTISGVYRR